MTYAKESSARLLNMWLAECGILAKTYLMYISLKSLNDQHALAHTGSARTTHRLV